VQIGHVPISALAFPYRRRQVDIAPTTAAGCPPILDVCYLNVFGSHIAPGIPTLCASCANADSVTRFFALLIKATYAVINDAFINVQPLTIIVFIMPMMNRKFSTKMSWIFAILIMLTILITLI